MSTPAYDAQGNPIGPDGRPYALPTVQADDRPRPAVVEALGHVRAMKACPFRAVGPGCGCGGAKCALRSGAVVSHRDCLDCLNRYDAWML